MAVMRLSYLFVNGGDSSTIRSMIPHDSSDSPGDAHSGLPMARVKGALWPNARKAAAVSHVSRLVQLALRVLVGARCVQL
jgi:hypothetical protein